MPAVLVSVSDEAVSAKLGERAALTVQLDVEGTVAVGAGQVVVFDRADPEGTPWCEATVPPTAAPGRVLIECGRDDVTSSALLDVRVSVHDGQGGPVLHLPPVGAELLIDDHVDPGTLPVEADEEPTPDTDTDTDTEDEAVGAPLAWEPGGRPEGLDADVTAVPERSRIIFGTSITATVTLTNTGTVPFTVPEPRVETTHFGREVLASDYCAGRPTVGSMVGLVAPGESRSVVCTLDGTDVKPSEIGFEADHLPCEGCAEERFQESRWIDWGVRAAPAAITVVPADPSLPPDALNHDAIQELATLAGDDVVLPAFFVTNETGDPITDAVFTVDGASQCTYRLGTLQPGTPGRRIVPACTLAWGVDIVDSGPVGVSVTGDWLGNPITSLGDLDVVVEYPMELVVEATVEPGPFDHGEKFRVDVVVTNPTQWEVSGLWNDVGPAPSTCDAHPTELSPGETFSFSCQVTAVVPYGWAEIHGAVVPCAAGCGEREIRGQGVYDVDVNETPLLLQVTPDRAVVSNTEDVVIEATVTNLGRAPLTGISGYLFDHPGCDLSIPSIPVGGSATTSCTLTAGTFSSIATFLFVSGTGSGPYAAYQNVTILVNEAPVPELDGFTLQATPRSSVVAVGEGVAVDLVLEGPDTIDPLSVELRQRPSGCSHWETVDAGSPTRIEATCWLTPEDDGLLQADYWALLTLGGSGGGGDRYALIEASTQVEVLGSGGLELSVATDDDMPEWGTPQTYQVTVTNTGPNAVDEVRLTLREDDPSIDCDPPVGTLGPGESVTLSCTGSSLDAQQALFTVSGTAAGTPVRTVGSTWFERIQPWDRDHRLTASISSATTWPAGDVVLTVVITANQLAASGGTELGYRVFSTDAPGCANDFFADDFDLDGDVGTMTYSCRLLAGQDTLPPNGIVLSLYAYDYHYSEGLVLMSLLLDTVVVPVTPVGPPPTTGPTTTAPPIVQPPPSSVPTPSTTPGAVPTTTAPPGVPTTVPVAPPTIPGVSPPAGPPTTTPGSEPPGPNPPPDEGTPPGFPPSQPGREPGGSYPPVPSLTRGMTFDDAEPPTDPGSSTPESTPDGRPVQRFVASLGVTQSTQPFAIVSVIVALVVVLLLGTRSASNEQRRAQPFEGEDL